MPGHIITVMSEENAIANGRIRKEWVFLFTR